MKSLVILMFLASHASADKWTRTDTAFEAITLLSLAIDHNQTNQIVRDANMQNPLVEEANPLIGGQGQNISPDAYFLMVALVHVTVAAVLPQPYRRISQLAIIAVQTHAITHNWSAGYEFKF